MAAIEMNERRHPSMSSMIDKSTIPEGYQERWVNRDPLNISKKRAKGYIMASRKKHKIKTRFEQEDSKREDVIVHGDRVLMLCKKEYREERKEDALRLHQRRKRNASNAAKRKAVSGKVQLLEGNRIAGEPGYDETDEPDAEVEL